MNNDKTIIITGASRGVGFELTKLFAAKNYKVIALSRNHKPVEALKLSNVVAFPFDLSHSDDISRLDTMLKEQDIKVDALINNAGRLLNKPFAEITTAEFEAVYKVNVIGLAAITRAVLPYMISSGHVVSISSMGGVQGSVKFPGLAAYSSSKGAVITLMELLAEEYKETGPSFNTLALGAVQTEMLEEAFPGYKAPLSASEMAEYIFDFALNGQKYYNGKLLQVSSSTP